MCNDGALARRLKDLKFGINDHDPKDSDHDQKGLVEKITKDLKKLDVSLSKSADLLADENDLKSGIIDHDLEKKAGTTGHQIMEDLKKLICMMAYPRLVTCSNLQLEITSSDESNYEDKRQTTVKPRPKRADTNYDNIDFEIRIMKR